MMHAAPANSARRRPGSSRWGTRALFTLLSGILLIVVFYLGGWLYWTVTTPLAVASQPPAAVAAFPGNGTGAPLLVSPDWLRQRQTSLGERLVIVDLSTLRRYERAHIPGAVHGWWQDTMDPYAHTYGRLFDMHSAPHGRAAILRSLGIAPDSTVVVYDDQQNQRAARFVWMLRFMGFQRSSVLDGGLAAWKGANEPVTAQWTSPRADVPLVTERKDVGMITTTSALKRMAGEPGVVILDARTRAETNDDLNGTIRTGRIPGAVWLPWNETTRDEAGRLKSPEELARLFQSAGVTPDKRIVIYGRFGVETGQTWMVLTLLGYQHVTVYDEGWATWAGTDSLPVEPMPAQPAG
jgi:thiosulfate/3-mercaptopyruvate sulfurtransferase